ncbi:MAG: hypothetical protein U1G05_18050 [Kiritimatiellia bacterium]
MLAAYGFTGAVTYPEAVRTSGLPPDEALELILPPPPPAYRPPPRIPVPAAPAAAPSAAANAVPEPAPPRRPPDAVPVRPAQRPAGAAEDWDDPEFKGALARLRAVREAYRKHVTGDEPADLNRLDQDLDQALRSLQSLRERAPNGARVGELIRAGNQLRFSLHQARKLL